MKKVLIVGLVGLILVFGSPVAWAGSRCSQATIELYGGWCPLDFGYRQGSAVAAGVNTAPGPLVPDTAAAAGLGAGLIAAGTGLDPLSAAGIGFFTLVLGKEIQYQRMKNQYQNWQETVWYCDSNGCRKETRGIQIQTGKKNVSPPK
ncbi:MAG: hypothetical protein ACPLW9_02050 [Minisyncoccales bacterium]